MTAPGSSHDLWRELCDHHMHAVCKEREDEVGGRSEKEVELLEAFAENYLNAQHWSTKRQILSLMADKLSLSELREFIPSITSYRYNIARRHRLLHGRAAPVPCQENKRMCIEPAKLEHFVSFITSPRIIQEVPFGEKLLKLSTGKEIRTPNVIRMMVPERIVQQYEQYCYESSFSPMSKKTLQRILAVCSVSTRKSLQGLHNFSAQGSQAFDDVAKLADKLVDCGKPQEWTRDIKQQLRSSKQYLQGDFKVRAISLVLPCLHSLRAGSCLGSSARAAEPQKGAAVKRERDLKRESALRLWCTFCMMLLRMILGFMEIPISFLFFYLHLKGFVQQARK